MLLLSLTSLYLLFKNSLNFSLKQLGKIHYLFISSQTNYLSYKIIAITQSKYLETFFS